MKAFYSGQFVLPLPTGHRFPMGKYVRLRARLEAELPQVQMLEAPRASDDALALAHTPAYIESVASGGISAVAMREIGFPWSEAMVERSRRSVGATVAAVRVAMQEGIAANMAGGTHHASASQGSGFCVFNDVAVAARTAQADWALAQQAQQAQMAQLALLANRTKRPLQVAVIDLDVHQGNGTASIFAGDDSVFTLSIHGEKNFPFRKVPGSLDVDLPDGCGDVDYLGALEGALFELDQRFNPGLVIYLAGADPHEGDRLGRLQVSFDGLMARDRRVMDWCFERHVPLAFAMAGGYGKRLEDSVQVQVNTFAVALDYWRHWQNRRNRAAA
jgi:acetoin utilization deacetylase AcuC-like enzyme